MTGASSCRPSPLSRMSPPHAGHWRGNFSPAFCRARPSWPPCAWASHSGCERCGCRRRGSRRAARVRRGAGHSTAGDARATENSSACRGLLSVIRTLASMENPLFSQASMAAAACALRNPWRLKKAITRRRTRSVSGAGWTLLKPIASRSSCKRFISERNLWSLTREVNRSGSQGWSDPYAAFLQSSDGGSHRWQQARLFGLKEDAKRAGHLEAKGLGDSPSFEVVEDDSIVRFIQRGLDDRSLAHVDLR